MNKVAIVVLVFLVSFVSAADMVTKKEEENSVLRLCTPDDVFGSWVKQDQILVKPLAETAAGKAIIRKSPYEVPNQAIFMLNNDDLRFFQYEDAPEVAENEKEQQERGIVREVMGSSRGPAPLKYRVDDNGRLYWTTASGGTEATFLCNIVLTTSRYPGRDHVLLPGDIILGLLVPTKQGKEIISEQMYRKRDPWR